MIPKWEKLRRKRMEERKKRERNGIDRILGQIPDVKRRPCGSHQVPRSLHILLPVGMSGPLALGTVGGCTGLSAVVTFSIGNREQRGH